VLHPHHALLAAARALAATDSFHDSYRRHRPMVERSIAWLVRGANRRLRYRGIDRNRLWLGHRVAPVNLHRLVNLGLTHRTDCWAIA
jgi:Transposase DDE domain